MFHLLFTSGSSSDESFYTAVNTFQVCVCHLSLPSLIIVYLRNINFIEAILFSLQLPPSFGTYAVPSCCQLIGDENNWGNGLIK